RCGHVALIGVSVRGSLALLAAEDPQLSSRVRLVAALAPYTNLADGVRIGTTSTYVRDGMLHRYTSKPFAALGAARSLAAALPRGPDRSLLLQRLEAVPDNSHDPLAALRRLDASRLRPVARALIRLLTNRDPERFHTLYVALPERLRRTVTLLSPLAG